MDFDSSSFDNINEQLFSTPFTDKIPIERSGATSDSFKVRIFSKWHFLKRPKKQFISNPIYVSAFEKEFDLGITLDHPNIVRYISKGNDEDGIYILTEYIDGYTLNEFRENNLHYFEDKENVKRFLLQLLSALEYLHNRQIVHLDIKPENIIITSNGNNAKLIDLGLSYSDCYSEITGGSQSFGSPEQFTKPEKISYKSDMYALGNLILYLFFGATELKKINKLPNPYKKITKKCLVDDVEKRNITVSECIQLLNQRKKTIWVIAPIFLLLVGFLFVVQLYKNDSSKNIEKTQNNDSVNVPLENKVDTTKNKIEANIPQIKSDKKVTIKEEPQQKPLSNINESEMNLENVINTEIKNRLSPNIPNLEKIYSDINEYNIDILSQSFADWKKSCDSDCQYLYNSKYKDKISYDKFKSLYNKELDKINKPIQDKLDKFKK